MPPTTSRLLAVLILVSAATTKLPGAVTEALLLPSPVRCLQESAMPDAPPPAEEAKATVPDESEHFNRVGRLLQTRCALPGCHLGPEAKLGLRLETDQIYRATVNVRARTDGRILRVAPGAPEQSLLYLKLLPAEASHRHAPRMPLGMEPLSEEEITQVREWIAAFPADRWGAPPTVETPVTAPRTFQDSALVNLPTPDPLGHGTLEFRILHRFKAAVRDAGTNDLFGFDSDAWYSIGLAYGLGKRLEAGLRRTNLQHDYEGYSKWTPILQKPDGPPLSLALRGSVSNLRETNGVNRNRYGAQAVLARRFGDHLSLMLVPSYVTRTNYVDAQDTRATGAVGVGGEWRIGLRMAVTGEYIAQLSGVQNEFQSGSIGYSIATARHAFHVFATNTAGAHTDLYVPGGDLAARDGRWRLGFNISRSFTPH